MKIVAFETIELGSESALPSLMLLKVHTDDGITGIGETYYLPRSCAAVIHEDIAPRLLGSDPTDVQGHWTHLNNAYSRFGARGAETRAMSAVDLALWDILGKVAGLPIYRLLGATNKDIRSYNTCGGPNYGISSGGGAQVGYGSSDQTGELDDYHAFLNRPGDLAQELVAEGYHGMKIWPFDQFAHTHGGHSIAAEDLAAGIQIVAEIRDAVGHQIEIMIEGHGFWDLGPAIKIARALEPYAPAWVEDLTLATKPRVLAQLRSATSVPISVSEYLVTSTDYMPILEAEAADMIMIDPTWAGGITESRKIATLADAFGLPVTFHDCTGPLTLLAGLHLSLATPNAIYQESVRAFLRVVYPDITTKVPKVEHGRISAPEMAGLGTELQPDLAHRPGAIVEVSRL